MTKIEFSWAFSDLVLDLDLIMIIIFPSWPYLTVIQIYEYWTTWSWSLTIFPVKIRSFEGSTFWNIAYVTWIIVYNL